MIVCGVICAMLLILALSGILGSELHYVWLVRDFRQVVLLGGLFYWGIVATCGAYHYVVLSCPCVGYAIVV